MSERLGGLSSRERELVEAVVVGDVLKCSQLACEQLAVTDDPAHIIRAEVLRDLLVNRGGKVLDPRGIRVRGARITGTLDLIHVQAPVGMELRECCVDQAVLLEDAHLPWLIMSGSCVPAVDGAGLQVDGDMFLGEGFRATGGGEQGAVRLRRARIGRQLCLSGAELTNPDGPALVGDELQVDGDLVLGEGFRATGGGGQGAVWLRGARVGGVLDLSGAELTNPDGPALFGDGLQVDGELFLRKEFRATSGGKRGAVRLLGARIGGQLDLSGAELTNSGGPALFGDGLQVGGGLFLGEGFRASGGGEQGAVRLPKARIGRGLDLSEAELTNPGGPALVGDGLQVDGDLFLREGFRATGGGEQGAARLLGARIGGQLGLSGAELTNPDGPALVGDGLQVGGGLVFREEFRASGTGEDGAVRLPRARIGGQLDLSEAELTNPDGPALVGDRLQVDGDLFLGEGFRATGGGGRGAVRLRGARIGGQLCLWGAELTNSGGPALVGDGLQVDDSLVLGKGFRASGTGEDGAVRLPRARIGGQLDLSEAELTNPDGLVLDLAGAETKQIFLPLEVIGPLAVAGRSACGGVTRRVDLNGFVYITHEDCWETWLDMIVRHTKDYRPQPYQQLVAVQRAAGHDSAAREILIAQQQDRRQRGQLGGWLSRTVHLLWGVFGGYGYRVGRIALALLVVLVATGGLGVAAGHLPTGPGRYVAMHTPLTGTPTAPCSLIEQIGVGIDRGLPLPTTGIRNRCDFDTTSRRGQAMTAASWLLQALVWALATLVVVGYSGLIRKTT